MTRLEPSHPKVAEILLPFLQNLNIPITDTIVQLHHGSHSILDQKFSEFGSRYRIIVHKNGVDRPDGVQMTEDMFSYIISMQISIFGWNDMCKTYSQLKQATFRRLEELFGKDSLVLNDNDEIRMVSHSIDENEDWLTLSVLNK